MLRLRLFPLIGRYRKIFLSMALMLALGIALLVAIVNACSSFSTSVDAYFETYDFPQLTVVTELFFPSRLNTAQSGVLQDAETRLVLDAQVTTAAGQLATGRCYFETADGLARRYTVLERAEMQEGLVSTRIDAVFRAYGGFDIGDRIEVKTALGTFTACITEELTGPENFVTYRDALNIFDCTDFGYLYFDVAEVADALGFSELPVNQWLFHSEADEAYVTALLARSVNVLNSFTLEDSPQRVNAEMNIEPLLQISVLLPSFVLLIAVLVEALLMAQMVREQRQEIGLMRAMGYTGRDIAALYAAFALLASAAAMVLGCAAGTLIGRLVAEIYRETYDMPSITQLYRWEAYAASCAAVLILGQISTVVSTLYVAQVDPAEAMRTTPRQVGGSFPRMRGIPETLKMQLRFALRNGRRTLVTVVSMAVTGMLLLVSVSYSAALDSNIYDTLDERYRYDVQISFDGISSADTLAECLSGISLLAETESAAYATVEVSFGEQSREVLLCGLQPDSKMVCLLDESGRSITLEDGLVLEYHTAQALGAEEGDSVLLVGRAYTVAAISYQNVQYTQYLPLELFAEANPEGAFSCVLASMTDAGEKNALNLALQTVDGLRYATYTSAIADGLAAYVNASRPAVVIVLIFGLVIGFLIIYNIAVIGYKERRRSYAVLMTQGMRRTVLAASTFAELLAERLLSLFITACAGIPAAHAMLAAIHTEEISLRNPRMPESFALVAALVLLYTALANSAAMLPLRTLDQADALKERE